MKRRESIDPLRSHTRHARVSVSVLLCLAVTLLAAVSPAHGDVTILANAVPETVSVGEAFRLEVRVRSTGLGSAGDLVMPDMKQLRRVGHSTSQTMSLVNGQATREHVEVFTYVADQPGLYSFQGLGVRAGAKFTAGPVVAVRVITPGQGLPRGSPHDAPQLAPESSRGDDRMALPPPGEDVFVTAMVDRERVRVGEPVVYTFRFYFRINPDQPTYDAPDFSGFQTHDLGQSKQAEAVQVGGYTYQYYDLRTLLYPLRTGDLTIGSAALTFRSSFFFTRQHRRETKPLTVSVQPLPESRPQGFAGAVGRFRVSTSGLPASVFVNEPASFYLHVSGVGNFDAVGAPEPVSAAGWRIYPGRVSNAVSATPIGQQGEKTFEVLLQPPEAGRIETPHFRFVYFDPEAEQYRSVVTSPGELSVQGGATAKRSERITPLALRPVRIELGGRLLDPLRPWRIMPWLLPLPFFGIVLLFAGRAVNRRMRTVTPAERKQAARRSLDRGLGDKRLDAAALLKVVDGWLHEYYGLAATPSEHEIKAALGDRADKLLHVRRRLQGAVFGGAALDIRGTQHALRQWLKGSLLVLLLGVGLGAGSLTADGDTARSLFQAAHAAQMEGRYDEAVRLYRRSAEHAGVRVNLLYNLAGAAWRSGSPGLARHAIETAYAHSPRDRDVAENRRLIAGAIQDRGGSDVAVAPGRLTLAETGWLTVALYLLLTAGVLAGWAWRPARWASVLLLVLSFPVWGYAAYLYQTETGDTPGVIWSPTELREGPGDNSATIGVLPAGEVAHTEEVGSGWQRVTTGNGLSGWIRSENWREFRLLGARSDIPE